MVQTSWSTSFAAESASSFSSANTSELPISTEPSATCFKPSPEPPPLTVTTQSGLASMNFSAAACARGSSAEEPAAVTSPETGAVEEAVSAAASVEAVSAAASVDAASVAAVVAAVVDALVEELEEPHPASIPAAIMAAARTLTTFLFFIMMFSSWPIGLFVCACLTDSAYGRGSP